ncbi:hypothetical protein CC80DRAFT_499711 [Byssothecium circinans]|uniref:C2H2-type domain-containing protein n=1 Tax=Byssothecium circinans TaxID=147558 RepID=A0A6A5UBM3_9PLEO|nr:hypothetical protein CC80DRAFT_499711 [Byssothecium circinans]
MEAFTHNASLALQVAQLLALLTTPSTTSQIPIFPPRCECPECETHFYSFIAQRSHPWLYHDQVGDDTARELINGYVKAINADRDYLLAAIQLRGDKILSRWQSLSKDPSVLIGMLHHRAMSHPSAWAGYDHSQLTLPWNVGALDVTFNENCVVMHNPNYGKLVPWDKQAAHQSDIIGFPRARLIFEAQTYIMNTLRKIVEVLSPNIPAGEAPSSLKWEVLLQAGLSRLNATGDHLWLLQTEPSYMRRYMNLVPRMDFAIKNHNKFGSQEIAVKVLEDAAGHRFWQEAVEEFEHVQTVYHQFQGSVQPGNALPKEIDEALGTLELVLVLKADLLGAGDDQRRFPIAMMLKFLDDHLAASTFKERSRLDEVLYESLSNYVTVIEMLAAVQMHYPKCTIAASTYTKRRVNRLHWRRRSANEVERPRDYRMGEALEKFRSTTVPNGPRNWKWLDDSEASHQALQGFWRAVYDWVEPYLRQKGLEARDIATSLRPISAWKSAEYRSLLDLNRQEILSELAKLKLKLQACDDAFLPLSRVVSDRAQRPIIPVPKTKEKSRPGEKCQSLNKEPIIHNAQQEQPPPTHIAVSKRALAVFRSIFPTTVEERQKVIDWDDFVLAMEDAGFRAKSGGGSIVTFEEACTTGKIIFHRPNPTPKIDPVMLQSMGRRLNKWFGWTRDIFPLGK